MARALLFPIPTEPGRRAYERGDWSGAARSAREVLKTRAGDLSALRLLARSSIRMGRDDLGLGIYTRRLGAEAIEAEDDLLRGVALIRRGQPDQALKAWDKALDAETVPARVLDELIHLYCAQGGPSGTSEDVGRHPIDQAVQAAERLRRRPSWQSRGDLMLASIRIAIHDVPGAAELFRRVLRSDPKEIDNTEDPVQLRKLAARTFLRVGRPAEARAALQPILSPGADPEADWLLSRTYLQEGEKAETEAAMARAGTYRKDHPLEDEPSPYVGESRCQPCHPALFRDSLSSRHSWTYHRGEKLHALPLPGRPLADPTDPRVTHTIKAVDGVPREETRVGATVFRSVIEYAFGTTDRYVTMVGRDDRDQYRIARLSYYRSPAGEGWDRTILDVSEPTHAEDYRGRPVGMVGGTIKCLSCHITFPRAGRERVGPETSDRAIGCERCHGPGAHHLAAVAAGLSDLAIVNPSDVPPRAVSERQCNDCHILDRSYRRDDRENPYWVRSQGVGWIWSRCNTESGGTFGCVTCHDPHRGSRSTTTAQYEARCLACHPATTAGARGGPGAPAGVTTPTGPRPCPVDPVKGCISCHMPIVRKDSSHLDLTDHYIRVRRP